MSTNDDPSGPGTGGDAPIAPSARAEADLDDPEPDATAPLVTAAAVEGALGGDLLEAGVPLPAPGRRSRRRLAVALTSAGVVLTVLAGGGAYAMMRLWERPTGALPEDVMPGSVAAFARINLSPGLGQRVKFEELLRKSHGNPGEQFADVESGLFEELGAPIAFEDVAPWFDDRVGVALWGAPAHPDEAVTLVAASAKDQGKARATLEAARRRRGTDHLGFVVADGYALLSVGEHDAQAAADAAAVEARRGPLAKADAFRSAVAKLPADQPLIGWADLAKANRLSPALRDEYLAEVEPGGALSEELGGPPPGAAAPSAPALELKGVAVLGVQAAGDGLEARVRLIGTGGLPGSTTGAQTDVLSVLGGLSADADAAGVVTGPLGDLTELLGPEAGYLPMGLFGTQAFAMAPMGDGDLPPGLLTGDPAEIEKYIEEHPELLENPRADGTVVIRGVETIGGVAGPDRLAESLASALGSAQSVSFTVAGRQDADGQVPVLLDLRMADAPAAARTQRDLADLSKLTKATCEVRDEHVTLRAAGYAGGSARLSGSALFQRAMTGAVARPVAAVYVAGGLMGDGPVRAVGVTAGRDGADAVLHARLVMV